MFCFFIYSVGFYWGFAGFLLPCGIITAALNTRYPQSLELQPSTFLLERCFRGYVDVGGGVNSHVGRWTFNKSWRVLSLKVKTRPDRLAEYSCFAFLYHILQLGKAAGERVCRFLFLPLYQCCDFIFHPCCSCSGFWCDTLDWEHKMNLVPFSCWR